MNKKNIRAFSTIALIAMLVATFAFLLPVSADTETSEPETDKDLMTTTEILRTYLTEVYENKEEKLAAMQYRKSSPNGDYRLYVDEYSGEVGVECVSTGEILLSNPHDVASVSSDITKEKFLSQIFIKYSDIEKGGDPIEFYTFKHSAPYGQINVKNTKSGIRVEYVLGKESTRSLVPRWIEATRFEQQIMAYIDPVEESYIYEKLRSFYSFKDPNGNLPEDVLNQYSEAYPCTNEEYYTEPVKIGLDQFSENTVGVDGKNKMAIYVLDTKTEESEKELNVLEGYLKRFCPHYNYEQVQYDHELTACPVTQKANAVFYVSVEYSITNDGLTATIPGNSIGYDESVFRLVSLTLLPYMGTSNGNIDDGYTFVPDGSGTIIENEDINAVKLQYTLTGQVYGNDYAYHKLASDGKGAVFSAPVFGIVSSNTTIERGEIISSREEIVYERDSSGNLVTDMGGQYIPVYVLDANGNRMYYPDGSPVVKTETIYEYDEIRNTQPGGVFAVITEGEALAHITSDHGGTIGHNYNSAYATFYPRCSDEYYLGDSISVGAGDKPIHITSDRKYTGRFTVKYFMLSSKENAKYDASYVGMANAYRDHLVNGGTISKITDAKADIPLYLETFGMIEVREIVMTVPTWVDTPLSTFEDVEKMYSLLGEAEITNVKFKLTGFTEGGWMNTLAPTSVKFEKVLGGNKGYNTLVENAEKTEGLFEVFPEFDFANVSTDTMFDNFNLSKNAIKTVDGRRTGKRAYTSIYQSFQYVGSTCVTPAAYEKMYGSFAKAIKKFNKNGISVSTLGSDLNTDFNEDNPLNREDGKQYTLDLLENLSKDFGSIMLDQGNAYTWKYADHILNIALDGSNFVRTTASVPFLGMVLHGYINIAGTPTNMKGDTTYEILKMIENGASPYYVLVMQNSSKLKDNSDYSEYYSIDFNNWYKDVVSTYSIVNDAIGDLQTSIVKDHKFLEGTRVLTETEENVINAEYEAKLALYKEARESALRAYLNKAQAIKKAMLEAELAGKEYLGEELLPFEYEEFVFNGSVDLTVDDESIVYVEYENGVFFILNYNSFAVRTVIDGITYEIEAFSFVKQYPND